MKPPVLLLVNSDAFRIMASFFLRPLADFSVLDVRYENEKMTPFQHFLHQLKQLFYEAHGVYSPEHPLLNNRYQFSFHTLLQNRLKDAFQKKAFGLVIFEMKNLDENEWLLLHFLTNTFSVPVVVFLPEHHTKEANLFSKLLEAGVREVLTEYEPSMFQSVINRNFKKK